MKTLGIALLSASIAAISLPSAATQQDAEEKAIREIIQLYFQGDINRDVESLKKAFHPRAELLTADEEGRLRVLTQPEWHERVRQTPERERPTAKILHIDRAGNAAVAKTQLIFSNGRFTDFLSLLKLDGRWMIINKTYQWEAE